MTPADEVEAHVQRAVTAADRLFEALEEIEQAGVWPMPSAAASPRAAPRSSPACGRPATSSRPRSGSAPAAR